MKPFEHGGDIIAFAETCGCNVNEVIDLSSNINFIKPHIDIDFNTVEIKLILIDITTWIKRFPMEV